MRLSVAVLARQRPPVGEHKVGRVLHERPKRPHALRRFQVEADARVDAPLAVVAEKDAVVRVAVEEFLEVAQVRAEVNRVDGRVLPARPCLELTWDA